MTHRFIHDILIFNDQKQILMTGEISFPQVETEAHFWQTCEPINHAIKQKFGLDVVTLRCIKALFGPHMNFFDYILAHRSGTPTAGHWVDVSDLHDNLRSTIQAEMKSHPKQPPWYAADWHLQLYQTFTNAEIQQVRSWERSSVWRIHDASKTSYLKAIPTMFAYERSLTVWLAEQFPETIVKPQLIGDDMMLMPEYKGQVLDETQPFHLWENVLSTYAQVQIQTMDSLNDLTDVGVPTRDMDWIATTTQQLFSDDNVLQHGWDPLGDDEVHELQKLLPQLKSYLDTLADVGSLEHGDLWNGQVFVDDRHITLTDFSDATLTHPFFSLIFFLWDIEDMLSHESNVVQRLTESYLKPFRKLYNDEKIKTMLASAQLISPLFTACRYYADILPQMTYTWEMESMIAFHLRILLANAQTAASIN